MCKIGFIFKLKMRFFYLLIGVRNYIKDMIMKIIEVYVEVFVVFLVFVIRVIQKVIEVVFEELIRLIQCVIEYGFYSFIQVRIVNFYLYGIVGFMFCDILYQFGQFFRYCFNYFLCNFGNEYWGDSKYFSMDFDDFYDYVFNVVFYFC